MGTPRDSVRRKLIAEIAYQLHARHRPKLLIAMMHSHASENAWISFEGVLANTELPRLHGASQEETDSIRRATLAPRLDFVILPLTHELLPAIEKAVISKVAFGARGIIHVQIEVNGKCVFAAYDGFQHAVAYAVSPRPLQELTDAGVLRGYRPMTKTIQPSTP